MTYVTSVPGADRMGAPRRDQRRLQPGESVVSIPNANVQTVTTADDSGAGLVLFFVFATAVLTVTGAVALLALVGTWWMLAVAFAIYVAMTMVVLLTILRVIAGSRLRAAAVRDRSLSAPGRRLESRPQARTEPATALMRSLTRTSPRSVPLHQELSDRADQGNDLRARARNGPLTIVYAARDREQSKAVVLAALVRDG